jgi:hypothetical protein
MEIKTLDDRIRQRGRDEWSQRVKEVVRAVNQLAQGDMRNQRMVVKTTTTTDGQQCTTIWQCIERLFEAIEAAGNLRAEDDAVAEFLKRFDDVATDIDELRNSIQN